ncbi:undecaprenyldiphospho-muramoylpentapeptide beta-N-acetylglucosaminyltransferase [Patescibacteria group bacterium AH-259-L07]|nr:undecaprenyldiphospho-muramoylpentapeptide beta-N-acetylglucosaminyltransferase [Patescibacteria group bacterium AH-259-L07]
MRIVLAGGGTGGSVSPLLAIAQELKKQLPEAEFLFIGTREGIPEKKLARMYTIPFKSIFSGKLRRYVSIRNIIDPFFIFVGLIQSFFIILQFKPHTILSAGGFVAVPVAWAGWLLHIPTFIHQQDIVPGLANKLLAPIAKKITVSAEASLKDFPKKKTVVTGNPVRVHVLQGNKERAFEIFNLEESLPTVLVIGGGSGALPINTFIAQIIPNLTQFCQVIHITGKDKQCNNVTIKQFNNYHQYEFLKTDIAHAYAIADVVISRAGMGVLTELAVLGKPTIIVPIPDSHQENNASYFSENKAALVLDQKTVTPKILFNTIQSLLSSDEKRAVLSLNILKLGNPDAAKNIAEMVLSAASRPSTQLS